MRPTIVITSSLAALCFAALAVWLYVNHSQGAAPPPAHEGDVSNGQGGVSDGRTNDKPPDPGEKPAVDPAVFDLPVQVAMWGREEFSPCYLDVGKKTLYRWKGVRLTREQLPPEYFRVTAAAPVLLAKDFNVEEVEPPVKYLESDGAYRPGYLERSGRFYQWKGVVLNKKELLDMSQDGKDPVAKPAFPSQRIHVTEIDMPAYLKDQPGRWRKT